MTRIALTLIAFAAHRPSGWPVAVKALGENAVHSSLADQLKLGAGRRRSPSQPTSANPRKESTRDPSTSHRPSALPPNPVAQSGLLTALVHDTAHAATLKCTDTRNPWTLVVSDGGTSASVWQDNVSNGGIRKGSTVSPKATRWRSSTTAGFASRTTPKAILPSARSPARSPAKTTLSRRHPRRRTPGP